MKELKSNTDADNSTRIRYVSKLTRIKYSTKSSRLCIEMTNDEKIEKDFRKDSRFYPFSKKHAATVL